MSACKKWQKIKINMLNDCVREITLSSLNDEPMSPGFRDHEQPQQANVEINVPQPLSLTPNTRLKSAQERSQKQRFK